jgi:formate transporter
MYFIPMGLFIKSGGDAAFWGSVGKTAVEYTHLTWGNFFLANLLPVTVGNIIGGGLMVGLVYWFIYLRPTWTGHPMQR